ncbi:hypothetical protein D0869_07781 [Hortaea werneckii]|uniref:Uncharacterized protein n=1 Tax=Hortaea werneckii TaxID=91943 RepID=A0A3M6X1V4_HORWE|nr:hypothetical protein D0869_07781 [Hortaea werneckii]RMX84671.1 hypothetical protein D0868_15449 [Hortaea werneckii]
MAEVHDDDNALFAIEVDVDDYADTAAADNPSSSTTNHQDDAATMPVSRTFQSESAFQVQKEAYRAKIDQGGLEAELVRAVPALLPLPPPPHRRETTSSEVGCRGGEVDEAGKVKLSKKETQLLGYTVGELYFSRKFQEVIELCERVLALCELDAKTKASVEKWIQRSRARATGQVGGG